MIPILDHEVDNFGDVAGIIEGPVHVVDRDGLGETLGVQVLRPNVIDINKPAGGPQVDEGVYQQCFCLWCGYAGGVPSLYRVWLSE